MTPGEVRVYHRPGLVHMEADDWAVGMRWRTAVELCMSLVVESRAAARADNVSDADFDVFWRAVRDQKAAALRDHGSPA